MKAIICTKDNKPLHPDDMKAIEEFLEYRKKRNSKKKKLASHTEQ